MGGARLSPGPELGSLSGVWFGPEPAFRLLQHLFPEQLLCAQQRDRATGSKMVRGQHAALGPQGRPTEEGSGQ